MNRIYENVENEESIAQAGELIHTIWGLDTFERQYEIDVALALGLEPKELLAIALDMGCESQVSRILLAAEQRGVDVDDHLAQFSIAW